MRLLRMKSHGSPALAHRKSSRATRVLGVVRERAVGWLTRKQSPELTSYCLEEHTRMSRTLRILFRRDPTKDRQRGKIPFEGYQILWPDGRPVDVGLDAFCKHGQRLLGLGRALAGCKERLIDLFCFPLRGRDDDLTRIPGHRVRRFMLMREGSRGRTTPRTGGA